MVRAHDPRFHCRYGRAAALQNDKLAVLDAINADALWTSSHSSTVTVRLQAITGGNLVHDRFAETLISLIPSLLLPRILY